MIIWKDIVGYEGLYQVSNTGLVKNHKGKVLVLHEDRNYLKAKLFKNGKQSTLRVHRLVAFAFIPNPLNLSDVNHKDLNTRNNAVSNLEWQSHKDNWQHYLNSDKLKGRPRKDRNATGI